MSFFSARGRTRPGRSHEIRAHGKGEESACRDVTTLERPRDYNAADDISSQTQEVVDEIDGLIAELQRRRKKVLSESARLQRELIGLQAFSQSAVRSTKVSTTHLSVFKVSTQCLSHLRKVAEAPTLSGPHVEDISDEEHRESGTGVSASADQVEAIATHKLTGPRPI